jgi:hypothetical protein
MVKVLWYLLFLCTYLAFTLAFMPVYKKITRTAKVPFWTQEIVNLLVASLLYLTSVLLAKYSSLLIAGFYFASAQVPILLEAVLNALQVGRERGLYQAELRWAGECFTLSHKLLVSIAGIVGFLAYLAFPVLAGIVYFSHHVPSTTVTIEVIRITLLTLFVGGVAAGLPTQVGVPFSENLNDTVRRRFFFTLSASLVPNGLLLAILLSTFNVSTKAAARSAGNFHLTYSPLVLIIVAAYFIAALLVPTVIGSMRSARWQGQLLEDQKQVLTEAIDILRTRTADPHNPTLTELAEKLQESRDTLVKNDQSIALGLSLDELKARQEQDALAVAIVKSPPPNVIEQQETSPPVNALQSTEARPESAPADVLSTPFYKALRQNFDDNNYYLARPYDPRFRYLDWLDSRIEKLHTTTNDLQSKRSGPARLKAAREWAEDYKAERDGLDETTKAPKTNTLGAVAASTLVTSVLTVFFTSFSDWLWTHVVHTLPK